MFVGCLLCKSFHCKTCSFVSSITHDGNDHMCLSISAPNCLCQKPLAHGTGLCIEISAFLKSFTVFIFSVTKWWQVWQLSVYCITTSTPCTNVLTAALTRVHSRIRLGEFPTLLHMSRNVKSPLGQRMSFSSNPIRKEEYTSLTLNMSVVP